MAIDAYVIRFATNEDQFLSFYLNSADFSKEALAIICRRHNLVSTGKKGELAHRIQLAAKDSIPVRQSIVENMVTRAKPWLVFKLGDVSLPQVTGNPEELLTQPGKAEWYGPIYCEDAPHATWYVRPVFIGHWEFIENFDGPHESNIRWMFFARISDGVLSYHWRGFSFTEEVENVSRPNSQFPYWQHVPKLMEEFESLLARCQTQTVELHKLILHQMWDRFRYDDTYAWGDIRIRAESGGVSLSARASKAVEIDVQGIRRLANTIRLAVDRELAQASNSQLPNSDWYDEVILRAIIRELGALSYEFELEGSDGTPLFRGHTYFGMKEGINSPDIFAHINLHTSTRPELEQMDFLLEFISSNGE